MAIASILAGIVSGMVSFVATLVMGQGVLLALGAYVVMGLVGALAIIAVGAVRTTGSKAPYGRAMVAARN